MNKRIHLQTSMISGPSEEDSLEKLSDPGTVAILNPSSACVIPSCGQVPQVRTTLMHNKAPKPLILWSHRHIIIILFYASFADEWVPVELFSKKMGPLDKRLKRLWHAFFVSVVVKINYQQKRGWSTSAKLNWGVPPQEVFHLLIVLYHGSFRFYRRLKLATDTARLNSYFHGNSDTKSVFL